MPYYPPPSAGGSVAGADTQVIFNDGGVYAGDSGFLWNKPDNVLTVGSAGSNTTGAVYCGFHSSSADFVKFGGNANFGLGWLNADGNMYYVYNGSAAMQFNGVGGVGAVGLRTNGLVRWTDAGNNLTSTYDLGIGRNAAGVLEVNSATAGTYRDIRVRTALCEASTTSQASLRLAHGSAPTSPVNGDMWTTTAGLFVRINGATVGPLS